MRAGGLPRAVSVRPFSVWLGRRDGVLDRFRDRPGERITWLFVPYYLSTRLSLSSSLSGRTLQELCLVATSLQLVEGSQQTYGRRLLQQRRNLFDHACLNVLTGKLCNAVQFRCARVEVGQDSQGSRTRRQPGHPPRRRTTTTKRRGDSMDR